MLSGLTHCSFLGQVLSPSQLLAAVSDPVPVDLGPASLLPTPTPNPQALGFEWLSKVCTDPQASCLAPASLLALRARGGFSLLCSLLSPAIPSAKCQGPATWQLGSDVATNALG